MIQNIQVVGNINDNELNKEVCILKFNDVWFLYRIKKTDNDFEFRIIHSEYKHVNNGLSTQIGQELFQYLLESHINVFN